MAYKIIGIHGLRRLAIRRPRGRVYAGDDADLLNDENEDDDDEVLRDAERKGEGCGREVDGRGGE